MARPSKPALNLSSVEATERVKEMLQTRRAIRGGDASGIDDIVSLPTGSGTSITEEGEAADSNEVRDVESGQLSN